MDSLVCREHNSSEADQYSEDGLRFHPAPYYFSLRNCCTPSLKPRSIGEPRFKYIRNGLSLEERVEESARRNEKAAHIIRHLHQTIQFCRYRADAIVYRVLCNLDVHCNVLRELRAMQRCRECVSRPPPRQTIIYPSNFTQRPLFGVIECSMDMMTDDEIRKLCMSVKKSWEENTPLATGADRILEVMGMSKFSDREEAILALRTVVTLDSMVDWVGDNDYYADAIDRPRVKAEKIKQ